VVYDDGWVAVESVAIENPDEERFDAMRDCEAAVASYWAANGAARRPARLWRAFYSGPPERSLWPS